VLIYERPSWHVHGACRPENMPLFFPPPGLNQSAPAAKAICAVCPVRRPCLQYALDHNEPYGIWGGLSARQRNAILRNTRLLNSQKPD